MTIDELQVLITANTKQLQSEINNTKKSINGLVKSASKSTSNLTSSFIKASVFTKTLGLAIQSVTKNLGGAVSRLDTLNNYTNVMSNLGISGEDAEASIQRLSDKLIGLPTTLDDAVSSVQRFTSANGNIKASTDMFLALNNAILSGGASTEIQASALEQLSQSYSKGKPDMMEWRTAMMAMPAQLKQIAIAMGYVNADKLGEALRNGDVSMNEFMTTIMKLNKEGANGFQSFEQQAVNSTGGVKTSMTNVKTAITRGLAEIMNAIGQSNIAGFFQGIASAINKVIPYITGFVKTCVWAVGSITSLFGGKTKKNVDNTKKSLSSIGTSASSSLDNATGSAKKLGKELGKLASFDEMNVLSESSSGSSSDDDSSGGAGDLGNLDFSDWDTAMDTTNSKVDELYNKMVNTFKWFTDGMNLQPLIDSFYNLGDAVSYLCSGVGDLLGDFITNYLKPLSTYVINDALPHFFNSTADAIKNIDFDKISNSLNNLWGALEPFSETVGDGLLWFYDNVILPISTIVINDVVPGFLDLLSGSIKILDKAINEVKPVFEWLWDSFLEPMVTWTGGVIGDVLSAIGDALSWISDNEVAVAILEGLGVAIGVVALAMNAMNIAAGVWNVIGTIATAVTGAFSAVMAVLTSPITLVIAAIAAVVAIVILLVKHWDEVKAVALAVWDKIKEIWGVVADWFNKNVIEPIKAFFEPIVDFFKNIFQTAIDNVKVIFENLVTIAKFVWDGIKNVFSVIGSWFKEKWDNAVNIIKTVFTPIKDFFSSVWDGIKNIFNTVTNFFKNVFTNAFNTVKNVFTPIVSFFSGIFDKIKNIFIKIGTTVGNVISGAFKGVVNGVLGAIENILNTPIRAVNGLIGVINKVPGINLSKLSTFNLPRLARGGVVDNPTVAMIGEAGKEAVMPLERNTGWMDNLAEKVASKVSGSGNPIQLVIKLGEDTIFDKFINYMEDKDFETNGEVFSL